MVSVVCVCLVNNRHPPCTHRAHRECTAHAPSAHLAHQARYGRYLLTIVFDMFFTVIIFKILYAKLVQPTHLLTYIIVALREAGTTYSLISLVA